MRFPHFPVKIKKYFLVEKSNRKGVVGFDQLNT